MAWYKYESVARATGAVILGALWIALVCVVLGMMTLAMVFLRWTLSLW